MKRREFLKKIFALAASLAFVSVIAKKENEYIQNKEYWERIEKAQLKLEKMEGTGYHPYCLSGFSRKPEDISSKFQGSHYSNIIPKDDKGWLL